MESLRTSVIGYGLAGRVFHCPFISAVPGLTLTAIVTNSHRDEAAAAFPQARVTGSVDEAISDSQTDLIVLATPPDTHLELAARALAAGKHVVVDKPFTKDAASALKLIQIGQLHQRVLAPFHNRRYDADFLTVRRLVQDGTLGRVTQVISHYDRFRPQPRPNTWKESGAASGGILYDLGPHLVDQALALFGTPQHVTASVRRDRDTTDMEDAFDLALHYQELKGNHLIYECHATMLAADASPRFRVHGTHGSFTKYGLDPQEPAMIAGARPPQLENDASTGWLQEDPSAWGKLTLATERTEPVKLSSEPYPSIAGDYRQFYVQVRDAIHGSSPLAIPTVDGYRTIRLLDLAAQSSRERRTLEVTLEM